MHLFRSQNLINIGLTTSKKYKTTTVTSKCYYNKNMNGDQKDCIFPMHILGGGSIGFLFAAAMRKACDDAVTMLLRSHHKPRLISTREGVAAAKLQVCRPSDLQVIQTCDIPVEIIGETKDTIKCLLICTKANDAMFALDSVWDRLDRDAANLIILSNGALAIRDSIQRHFHDHQNVKIITSTTTHGVYTKQVSDSESIDKYCIVHAGDGLTFCTNNNFIDACQKAGWLGAALSEFEMNMMLWKKMAVNCVINPLTAIHGVKNGRLLSLDDSDETITHILKEVSSISMLEMESFIKKGENLKSIQDQLLRSVRKQLSVDSLETFVTKVMADKADNISSMLQDVRANKRTTEVRFLNGYVALLGKEKYNIDCSWNEEICNKVEDLL